MRGVTQCGACWQQAVLDTYGRCESCRQEELARSEFIARFLAQLEHGPAFELGYVRREFEDAWWVRFS